MAFMPDYCTVAELKAYLRIGDTADDTQLGYAITAASRAIDQYCNRQFGVESTGVARIYTAEWIRDEYLYAIPVDDIMNLTGLTIKVDTVIPLTFDQTITTYRMFPFNAAADQKPYTKILVTWDSTIFPIYPIMRSGLRLGHVQVTGLWGWTAVPTAVKQATLLQASRIFSRRESVMGVQGSSEFGSAEMVSRYVEPDVAMMLRQYRRYWGAVK